MLAKLFKNQNWLKQALTHRSYLNEHPEVAAENNERLEFLGDAILELATTEFLFHKFPERSEGELTAFRAALVNTETLSQVAAALGLNDQLLLSRGEAREAPDSRARQTILADAFEAVIGALYLDQGYVAAQKFIAQQLFPKIDEIVAKNLWQDAKSFFQEQAQARENITPNYQVLSAAGPDHNKLFTVGLYLGDELVAQGTGVSKQKAEQDAARQGLTKRGWD